MTAAPATQDPHRPAAGAPATPDPHRPAAPDPGRLPLACTVNGAAVELSVPANRLLIDLLREDLGLTGAKRSCDVQVCGACTVLVDGDAVSACTCLALEVNGRQVETVEGLERDGELHPLQRAFVDQGGLQCGYCTPGMLMSAKALLAEIPQPTAAEVAEYLEGNLCRCTGYKRIVAAVLAAARDAGAPP